MENVTLTLGLVAKEGRRKTSGQVTVYYHGPRIFELWVKLIRIYLCDVIINNIISQVKISLRVLFNPTSDVLRMNEYYITAET